MTDRRSSDSGECILLGHGGGGRLMNELIRERIGVLYQEGDSSEHDSALFFAPSHQLAMTTDSFVVHPLFFPGGDIGCLSVYGSVNDLAMAGALPRYLSLSFILEEGLPIATFDRVVQSVRRAAQEVGVRIITGDTKVVERGKGDEIYINTTGIGYFKRDHFIHPRRIMAGDCILLSGDIGRHGVAVMNARQADEAFDLDIISDCAPLHKIVEALLDARIDIHCLRDLTRGGLAAGLYELAECAKLSAVLREEEIPIDPQVAAYCDILGLEAYYLANEGRFVCIVPEAEVQATLNIMRSFSEAKKACAIGVFSSYAQGYVKMRSQWGADRVMTLLSGEQLPRIC